MAKPRILLGGPPSGNWAFAPHLYTSARKLDWAPPNVLAVAAIGQELPRFMRPWSALGGASARLRS